VVCGDKKCCEFVNEKDLIKFAALKGRGMGRVIAAKVGRSFSIRATCHHSDTVVTRSVASIPC